MVQNSVGYHFYWNGPFSQWQHAEFDLDNVQFVTAEQAMMHQKALLFGDVEIAEAILLSADPGKQKALGRRVKNFDEGVWDAQKYEIVRRINYAKFSQNKGLRRKLFQTGEKKLVEASPLDTIWGIGLDINTAEITDPALWPGQNLLGQILTQVRDQLAIECPDEAAQVATDSENWDEQRR